jgi:hypothetical protein
MTFPMVAQLCTVNPRPCIPPSAHLHSLDVITPPCLWCGGNSPRVLCGFASSTSSICSASKSQEGHVRSVLSAFVFWRRQRLPISIALLASVSGAISWNEGALAIHSVYSPGESEVSAPVAIASISILFPLPRTPWVGAGVCPFYHRGGSCPLGIYVSCETSHSWV